MKDDRYIAGTKLRPAVNSSPKLRAALEYLGDKLVTHRASRFRPATSSLLDEWLAARRTLKASLTHRADTCGVVGVGMHTIPEFLRKGLQLPIPEIRQWPIACPDQTKEERNGKYARFQRRLRSAQTSSTACGPCSPRRAV
jgi:hypothetical protein